PRFQGMDASPVTLGAPVRKKSNHPPQGIHSHGRARVPVRTHTRPCSRREQGLVSHGGAEGIRTPDPLDANEVRYRTAPQPRGHTQASRVRRVLRTHRTRTWMSPPRHLGGSYSKKFWWTLQSPAARRRASTYWS